MDDLLSTLMKKVVGNTLLIAVPLAVLVLIFRNYWAALSFLGGAIMASTGFALSVYVTTIALKDQASPFLPIITSMAKALVTAGVGFLFFLVNRENVFFYIAGFVILFIGIFRYTKNSEKEMK
ncbi:MAG: hypothetical protein QMB63_03470 [Clostridiaceae bacterium]